MALTQIRGNTQIMAATLFDGQINAAAAIATSKLADAANFILRSGSVAFTANQSMGGNKLTNVGTPTADTDAANKAYVDGARAGLSVKDPCVAATLGNITLSGTQTADGVNLAVGDRVLVREQTAPEQNGIYVVASGAWSRATDADASAEVMPGMYVFVQRGSLYADCGFVLTTDAPITLGTTGLTFTQFSQAGVITAGAGLNKAGNTMSLYIANDDSTASAHYLLFANGTTGARAATTDSALTFNPATNALTIVGGSINAALDATNLTGTINNARIDGTSANTASKVVIRDASGNFAANVITASLTGNASTATTATTATNATNVAVTDESSVSATRYLAFVAGTSGNRGVGADSTLVYNPSANTLSIAGGSIAANLDASYIVSGTIPSGRFGKFITREKPTGLVNGTNTTFTLAGSPVAGSEAVYFNGVLLEPGAGNDYTISGATITMLFAPVTADKLRVSYLAA